MFKNLGILAAGTGLALVLSGCTSRPYDARGEQLHRMASALDHAIRIQLETEGPPRGDASATPLTPRQRELYKLRMDLVAANLAVGFGETYPEFSDEAAQELARIESEFHRIQAESNTANRR